MSKKTDNGSDAQLDWLGGLHRKPGPYQSWRLGRFIVVMQHSV
jgi:hypothetical protein